MKSLQEERRIIALFNEVKNKGEFLRYKGESYNVLLVGKPVYISGEGKTDIYLLLKNDFRTLEIKISSKMSSAEFLENKLVPQSAQRVLGDNWENIIYESALSLSEQFESLDLYSEKNNSCTVGYRVDIANKARTLSRLISLPERYKNEVLLGYNLDEAKRNVRVQDNFIQNAGVATHLLLNAEGYNTAQDILDNLQTPEEIELNFYLVFCAVNYFIGTGKCESRRLGVYVDWSSGEPTINYNNPLSHTSTEMKNILKEIL